MCFDCVYFGITQRLQFGNQNLLNEVTTVCEVGTAIGMYRTVSFVGANLAVAVLQLTAGGAVGDAGLHRIGVFIIVVAALLLAGSCSPAIWVRVRSVMLRRAAADITQRPASRRTSSWACGSTHGRGEHRIELRSRRIDPGRTSRKMLQEGALKNAVERRIGGRRVDRGFDAS